MPAIPIPKFRPKQERMSLEDLRRSLFRQKDLSRDLRKKILKEAGRYPQGISERDLRRITSRIERRKGKSFGIRGRKETKSAPRTPPSVPF